VLIASLRSLGKATTLVILFDSSQEQPTSYWKTLKKPWRCILKIQFRKRIGSWLPKHPAQLDESLLKGA